MSKKYEPMVIPRKKWSERWEWFDMLREKNRVSVAHRKQWQEIGVKKLSGWIVVNNKGEYLPSTFSCGKKSAVKKCLETPLQKFNGIISALWSEGEEVGYRVLKVEMKVKP